MVLKLTARFESFRALKHSNLESFRALKLTRLESFRVLKLSNLAVSFRTLKLSNLDSFRARNFPSDKSICMKTVVTIQKRHFFFSLIYPAVKSKKIRQLKPVEYLGLQVYYTHHSIINIIQTLQAISFQIQNIPVDFEKCTSDDIEFFLCREKPILGVNAKKHPNPKVINYLAFICPLTLF